LNNNEDLCWERHRKLRSCEYIIRHFPNFTLLGNKVIYRTEKMIFALNEK